MKINGKGLIIEQAGETTNYFGFKDNKELENMLTRFYKEQKLKGITIINFDTKEVNWIDDDTDYGKIMKELI